MAIQSWSARRRFPLLATVLLLALGMATTTWGAHLVGGDSWSVPHDLWRTLVAAHRLSQLDVGGLYTPPTALITFPGAAVLLLPIVLVVDGTGIGLVFQSPTNPEPPAWLLAGPYQILVSATVLFAADSIAERWAAGPRDRAVLAAAGGVALWSVSVRWGHPEDAVAVALLLWAILALTDARLNRAAWLIGAAVAVQPLVLLALPVTLAVVERRRLVGFLVRAAAPATALVGVALAANGRATWRALTDQPNWPTSGSTHRTPWTVLAPDIGGGAVAAGPGRVLAIVLAGGCALVVGRRWSATRTGGRFGAPELPELLWWVALSFAFRCAFESVMVAYYLWPVVAVALVAAAAHRARLLHTAAVAVVLIAVSEFEWRGPWAWWSTVVTGSVLMLIAARPRRVDLSSTVSPESAAA